LKIGKEKEKDMERLANKFRISISALAVGITAIVASGQQSLPVKEAVATPNQVTYQEVKSHRIGDRPEIRIDLVAVGQPAAIMLQMGIVCEGRGKSGRPCYFGDLRGRRRFGNPKEG
jgi:hypothetical protein